MTFALIAALVAVIIANAWLADRKDRRNHEERQADRLERAGLTGRLESLQREHRAEVAALCQRIQAPEYAVVEHAQQSQAEENGYPMTDQETAEAQAERLAAIDRIEQMERDGVYA